MSGRPGATTPTDWGVGLMVFALSAMLIVIRLAAPSVLVFDETHYVRQGFEFYNGTGWTNHSHPPLAKWLIGASQSLLGENAFGWRIPGALLGALVPTCVFAVMRLFGFAVLESLIAAALTMLNQSLFVQARTAMLDVYALGFFAISATWLIWSAKRVRSRFGATLGLIVSGLFLGAAAASKWSAGINMMLVWIGIIIWRITETSPKGPFLPRLFGQGFAGWRHFSLVGAGLRQGIFAIAAYVAAFLPFMGMDGGMDLIGVHTKMFSDVSGPLADHTYASRWWEWPAMLNPIWYHFDRPPGADIGDQAVFLIGNPAIYWTGFVCLLTVLIFGVTRADGAMLAISGAFFGFWLIWAIIPRDLTFSYYYEPSAMMLGMGIIAFIDRILPVNSRPYAMWIFTALAAGLFVFFYPVLAALPMEQHQWVQYVWFPIWR